jgi:cell division transport system permease protein
MALSYSFKLAAHSIWHEKWINLLSVLTIAAGLLITAVTILAVYNIDAATRRLPEKFSIMVYLSDNLSPQEVANIVDAAGKENIVEKVTYIPKDEALKELKSTLKDTAYVLNGLGENPLPDAIEVKLKNSAMGPDTVQNFTARLRAISGVSEVEYGEKFLSSIYSLRTGMQGVGIVFVIMLSAGMVFVCYSTVKILFYRKRREIDTYKLLGATKGFIRAPFIIEGAVIGLSSGLLGLIGILSLYYLVILQIRLSFPIFKMLIFPVNMSFVLPAAGLLLGIVGAVIAIGRIKY